MASNTADLVLNIIARDKASKGAGEARVAVRRSRHGIGVLVKSGRPRQPILDITHCI